LNPTQTRRIVVVDDDHAVRTALHVNLQKAGFEVHLANSGDAAISILQEREIDICLSDVKMPGMNGIEFLQQVQNRWPNIPVVMMTGHGTIENAVTAMKTGASQYIIKPISKDELVVILEHTLEESALRKEVDQLRKELDNKFGFEQLIGINTKMRAVYNLVASVAEADALVMLTGATGTGKELLAHAIHQRSGRKGPYVAVNCAALPEGLLESELFGHERGAFTGAVRQHRGKFEQAAGGTLLLDEIGEVSLATQARLLRVLESGDLQRVGGTKTIRVNVRVIVSTNRDLAEEVREGRFRKDLYYRLNVFHISVPPLRERLDDLPLLVEHFIERFRKRFDKPAKRLSDQAMAQIKHHDWPGNVRELEHVIERAVLVTQGEVIDNVTIGANTDRNTQTDPSAMSWLASLEPNTPIPQLLQEVERQIIVQALREEQGVQARAARRLGVSRSNLNYRIGKLGICIKDIVYE